MKVSDFYHKIANAGFWICIALALAPFLYAYGFCVVNGDDFDEAQKAMFIFDLPGAAYDSVRNWLTWSGRYSYHFLAVFLAKSLTNPWSLALACLLPIIIFALAAYFLARLDDYAYPAHFAGVCLLILYTGFPAVQVFYQYMDCFSSVLQGSAYLLFLCACMGLQAKNSDMQRQSFAWKFCLFSGIFAIGIYETSALAVFWTAFAFWGLRFLERLKHEDAWPENTNLGRNVLAWLRKDPLSRLTFWLCLAFLFCFLAPGNFHRSLTRYVPAETKWDRIVQAFPDWLHIHAAYLQDALFWQIACLGFLSILLRVSSRRMKHVRLKIAVLVAAYLGFSLSLRFFLALTDINISPGDKFYSFFWFYMAIFECLLIHVLCFNGVVKFAARICLKRFTAFICFLLIFICGMQSFNFRETFCNAASGELLAHGRYLQARIDAIKKLSRDTCGDKYWPSSGLLGEIEDRQARRPVVRPHLPHVTMDSWKDVIFPLLYRPYIFTQNPAVWPNKWAAWHYKIGSICELPPNPVYALDKIANREGAPLQPPGFLASLGVSNAWITTAKGNMDIELQWLLLKADDPLPKILWVLTPSRVNYRRLLPFCLQKRFFGELVEQTSLKMDLSARLSSLIFKFETARHRQKQYYVFPLAGCELPAPEIFVSADGYNFEKMGKIK